MTRRDLKQFPDRDEEIKRLVRQRQGRSMAQIAEDFGISRTRLYDILDADDPVKLEKRRHRQREYAKRRYKKLREVQA